MDAFRGVLNSPTSPGSSADEETGILNGFEDVTRMSWSTRLKCFCVCFLLGIVFSLLCTVALFFGLKSGLRPFAVFYTLGNVFSIGSTMFLVGPMKQLKNIFAPTRLIASIIVLISFVLTMIDAFVVKSAELALLMVVIQSLAMTWYSISLHYIPFARDVVARLCGSLV